MRIAPAVSISLLMLATPALADRYIVGYRKQADADRAASARVVTHRYTHAVHGFAAELTDADVAALRADPGVAFVAANDVVHATGATWGLDRVDQRALPLDQAYHAFGDGTGVTVYVIDTGLRATHGDLAGRVSPGATAIDDGLGTGDCAGHGSHVAGTIAGTTWGVAKQARVVPIRVLDCNAQGSVDDVIAAIDYVAENAVPNSVVNMSLGAPANDAVDAAVRALVASGVTVVVAAGNDNVDACTQSPAREPAAITVAATRDTDARASFSNWGSCVDIFGPGENITSIGIASDLASAVYSGTSMASPHVAGAAAAYLGAHPGASPAQVTAALLAAATHDKVTDPRSVNLLLYTGATAAPPMPMPTPDPMPTPMPDDDDDDAPEVVGGCSGAGHPTWFAALLVVGALVRRRVR